VKLDPERNEGLLAKLEIVRTGKRYAAERRSIDTGVLERRNWRGREGQTNDKGRWGDKD
jgi:hypothetical protein